MGAQQRASARRSAAMVDSRPASAIAAQGGPEPNPTWYSRPVITVHHLELSRSHRVLWLLEELALPYTMVRYARDPKTMLAPPTLSAVHPLGKAPVVIDGDRTIAESAVILEELAERHGNGRLLPERDHPDFARCRYFMHYAEGSLMPPLLVKLLCARVKDAPLPFFVKPIARKIADGVGELFVEPNLRRHAAFLETELTDRTWFCGDELTIADIQLSYPIEALVSRVPEHAGPRLRALMQRMRARPAYQRALAKGGPVIPE